MLEETKELENGIKNTSARAWLIKGSSGRSWKERIVVWYKEKEIVLRSPIFIFTQVYQRQSVNDSSIIKNTLPKGKVSLLVKDKKVPPLMAAGLIGIIIKYPVATSLDSLSNHPYYTAGICIGGLGGVLIYDTISNAGGTLKMIMKGCSGLWELTVEGYSIMRNCFPGGSKEILKNAEAMNKANEQIIKTEKKTLESVVGTAEKVEKVNKPYLDAVVQEKAKEFLRREEEKLQMPHDLEASKKALDSKRIENT